MNSRMFDRAVRLQILTDANHECQLRYRGCTVTAAEIADCGELKASCRNCRILREERISDGLRMAAERMRRT